MLHVVAATIGLVTLVAGILLAWWIAHDLERRLRVIAGVATAATAGDLTGHVGDETSDEIGRVARAFDGMVTQLRHLIVRLRHAAKRDQDRLEALVTARTAEIDRRNAALQLVFDHIDQGFMTVGLDGQIAPEHSAAVERWLGPMPARITFTDYIRTFAPQAADWFEMSWTALVARTMPAELCLAQLPSKFAVGGRHLVWSYKMVTDEVGDPRVLVVISDETAVVERERGAREAREMTALLACMLDDRAGFIAFCAEADVQVATIRAATDDMLRRAVHTLKGISAITNLASLAELCHDLETALAEGDEVGARALRSAIGSRWQALRARVATFIETAASHVDVSASDLVELEDAIARGGSAGELSRIVATWRHDRVAPRLERLADHAQVLASRLCKDPLDVQVEVEPELRLPSDRWGPIWAAFVHALRNALDHGVETSAERARRGKPARSVLFLRARRRRGAQPTIEIELEDQGRGIDWARVAAAAQARGLPTATPEDLQRALFTDGLSTATTITEVSGRGVGLGALRDACERSGGRLAITSVPDVGTRLTATWPEVEARASWGGSERHRADQLDTVAGARVREDERGRVQV
ncbi:MAG: HAMP domain-containing protein [Proteobacteria bacterium]|nr:HAMP domain-containing protein [Pseudomonadota bacterium]